MYTTVTELLRNFPKIRRAAMAGEQVIIRTREGNLLLSAEKPGADRLFGAMTASIKADRLEPGDSGADDGDWKPGL